MGGFFVGFGKYDCLALENPDDGLTTPNNEIYNLKKQRAGTGNFGAENWSWKEPNTSFFEGTC